MLNSWTEKSYFERGIKRLLVIDDCKKVTDLINHYFKQDKKLKILSCNNEFEAIRLVVETKPDIILIDVNLETLNGFILNSIIKKLGLMPIPTIFFSSKQFKACKLEEQLAQNEYFIKKPLKKETLENMVYKVLKLAS